MSWAWAIGNLFSKLKGLFLPLEVDCGKSVKLAGVGGWQARLEEVVRSQRK